MAYTEYKFDPDWVKRQIKKLRVSLKKNTGRSNLLEHGLQVICDRLDKDPRRYRDYGPYWWALKKLINKYMPERFPDDMNNMDETIANEYKGSTDTETLVMADEFRNDYLKAFFLDTNEFVLDPDEAEPYVLLDSDCEKWKLLVMMGLL